MNLQIIFLSINIHGCLFRDSAPVNYKIGKHGRNFYEVVNGDALVIGVRGIDTAGHGTAD